MFRLPALHKVSGIAGMLLIAAFWTSTAVSELFMTHADIAMVKTAILIAIPFLVVSMATAGATGARLAGEKPTPWARRKQKRMMVAAANGMLVLVPAAIFLWWKTNAGAFDTAFYAVQAIELVARPVNLVLLGLNARDGMRLASAKRARAAASANTA